MPAAAPMVVWSGGGARYAEHEEAGLDPLAQHHDEDEEGEREAAAPADRAVDIPPDVPRQSAGLPAHPEHHVRQEPDGKEQRTGLEDLLRRPSKLARRREQHAGEDQRERDRRPNPVPYLPALLVMVDLGQISQHYGHQ